MPPGELSSTVSRAISSDAAVAGIVGQALHLLLVIAVRDQLGLRAPDLVVAIVAVPQHDPALAPLTPNSSGGTFSTRAQPYLRTREIFTSCTRSGIGGGGGGMGGPEA